MTTLHVKGFNMTTGISRFTKGESNQDALDEVYNKGKDLYVAEVTPPSSGLLPNSTDLIWDDTYGGNLNFTTATSTSQGQYNPSQPPFEIGTDDYIVPYANMWTEIELEGIDTSCSETINQAVNTRVELAGYEGWWKDVSGTWHVMNRRGRGGTIAPNPYDLVDGFRGCEQQVFKDARDISRYTIHDSIVTPGRADDTWSPDQHLFIKPENYFRWHGWGDKTIFDTYTTCKAIVWQMYMRLVVEDENLPDDRHLARYVAHTGTDRKIWAQDPKDGVWKWMQLWNIEISRFKRITSDWQPFNLCNGIMSKAELEANPPPFTSIPV